VSISYYLGLGTQSSAAQVAAELRHIATTLGLLDASVTIDDVLDGAVTGAGTWVRVTEAPRPRDIEVNDRGFAWTVSAVFQLDNVPDHTGQKDDVVRMVSGLLDRVIGDAMLHLDFEIIWLLRRDGELCLSERDDLWTPARLSAISRTYRRAALTFT
jgi:hypothetical protein